MPLKESRGEGNLELACANASEANRPYLYFASKADIEDQDDAAIVIRFTAEGETGHAHRHLA